MRVTRTWINGYQIVLKRLLFGRCLSMMGRYRSLFVGQGKWYQNRLGEKTVSALTEHEQERYRRQLILPEWGEVGQEKLKRAHVVVVGAGGLGSAVLTYLALAGIGTIRIIDADRVELSNLNRQMLHGQGDLGRMKVDSAKQRLMALNPDIQVETVAEKIDVGNAVDLIGDYPIVDALDNLPTRLVLNRVAIERKLPLFHGAVRGFEGRATTVIPGETPCLECLYKGHVEEEVPVVGVTPGIIGCIQATEVIKYVLEIGALLKNRLLMFDGATGQVSEVRLKLDPQCDACR